MLRLERYYAFIALPETTKLKPTAGTSGSVVTA